MSLAKHWMRSALETHSESAVVDDERHLIVAAYRLKPKNESFSGIDMYNVHARACDIIRRNEDSMYVASMEYLPPPKDGITCRLCSLAYVTESQRRLRWTP